MDALTGGSYQSDVHFEPRSPENPWIQCVRVRGYDLDEEDLPVARDCKAYIIDRSSTPDFYGDTEAFFRPVEDFGFGLFDRHGRLNTDIMRHPIKKGSGLWGEELDRSYILYITVIKCENNRFKDLKKNILLDLVDKVAERMDNNPLFALVDPKVIAKHAAPLWGDFALDRHTRENAMFSIWDFLRYADFPPYRTDWNVWSCSRSCSSMSPTISCGRLRPTLANTATPVQSSKVSYPTNSITLQDGEFLSSLRTQFQRAGPGADQWREDITTGKTSYILPPWFPSHDRPPGSSRRLQSSLRCATMLVILRSRPSS